MNKKQNINQLVAELTQTFTKRFSDKTLCQQYAWWTIEAITGQGQAHLIAHGDIVLTDAQQQKMSDWLDAIINQHKPIQYLLGSVPFNDIDILVEPPTLIPRPETEEWCLQLIDQLQKLENKELTIIEPCTGSGCIALALAHALPHATVYATDISEYAISLAQKNAGHNAITNVTFLQSDLFEKLPRDIRADMIVVNPPYIADSEWFQLDKSVTQWEDKRALVAHDNGLAIIERIINEAPRWLRSNTDLQRANIPQIMIEIGYKQAPDVATLMQRAHYNAIQVHKDLEEKDRVISGRVDYVETQAA